MKNIAYIVALGVACTLVTGCCSTLTKQSLELHRDYIEDNQHRAAQYLETGRITQSQHDAWQTRNAEARQNIDILTNEVGE